VAFPRFHAHQEKPGYNTELKSFVQSYEANTVLDSSILLAPLVFFIAPSDPRFVNTINRIMLPPEEGGLTSTGLVYRYDTDESDDGRSYFGSERVNGKISN
jgi:GH15 family glucan-1,4-alpha-glucosidase